MSYENTIKNIMAAPRLENIFPSANNATSVYFIHYEINVPTFNIL